MYARLWWKDARQFWPIWVFLALAAATTQWLMLYYLGQDAQQGALGCLALTCASFYAFATGAAAFAGEREAGTLRLLDMIPLDRRVVWASKVSFALVTTLALALLLLAIAALGSDQWRPQGSLSVWEAFGFGMIVLLALGWGLFWSAIVNTALTAAVLAICCTGISLGLLMYRLDHVIANRFELPAFVAWYLFIFLATLIASIVIFARVIQWKHFQLEFRSPVVVNMARTAASEPTLLRIQSPVTTPLMPGSVTTENAYAGAASERPRRSWVVEARALAWQTFREGWKGWLLLAAIGVVLPAPIYVATRFLDSIWLILIGIGVSLVAGATVFGRETSAGTQRFLAIHGARSWLVWLVKLLVWGVGILMLWGPLAVMAKISFAQMGAATADNWLFGILVIPLYFSIALVSGMAIRRNITAVVVSLVFGLMLTIPLGALITAQMLPPQGLLVIPAALLFISWAWSGDWLLDRPGSGRWFRLGLLVTGTLALIITGYAGFRAWSIRDVRPIDPPPIWLETASASLPVDQNAADLYRKAGQQLTGPFKDSPEFLDRNRGVLDVLRQATTRPNCQFLEPLKLNMIDQPDLPPLSNLAFLLALEASERQNHGDFGGAWDDIMALLRMARHSNEGTGLGWTFTTIVWIERTALGVALEWAVAQGQTPEQLHAALIAYRDFPRMPTAADMVRAEANVVENTLDLPTNQIRDWFFKSSTGLSRSQVVFSSMLFDLATTPWERVRARRLNRLLANQAIEDAMREPWQRSQRTDPEIAHAKKTSRTAMILMPNLEGYIQANDTNEVARRALTLVLALREWQLRHDGQFPPKLDVLSPEELANIPKDPFSGQPFGYVRSQGQEVSPLRQALAASPSTSHIASPGSWLLYSVGLDGRDDGGITFKSKDNRRQPMDIVFEIPPVSGRTDPGKGKDQSRDKPKDSDASKPSAPSKPQP